MQEVIKKKKIYLSVPHMGEETVRCVNEVLEGNWVSTVGPQLETFENAFCARVGCKHAVALNSGTAALHLSLHVLGIRAGDEVVCSMFTFIATANPIAYLGAKPIFIDAEEATWQMDPALLKGFLERRARENKLPKAVILAHIYGQTGDIEAINEICERYEVPLIEDAAEALGAQYRGKSPGIYGVMGIFSFNGNKIITTSGGGMLVTDNLALAERARYLSVQARNLGGEFDHGDVGYNYRLSNILAGIGIAQLAVLSERVALRRRVFNYYVEHLGDLPGVAFMPEPRYCESTHWLTCLTLDPKATVIGNKAIMKALCLEEIESRFLWKPLHQQLPYRDCECVGGRVSEKLRDRGLCLPSSSNLILEDLERVKDAFRGALKERAMERGRFGC